MILKALIVGCGRIAGIADIGEGPPTTHAAGYRMTPGIELAGCVDTDSDKAAAFAENHGCEPYGSYDEALKQLRPEVVSVCTPDETHYVIVKGLLTGENAPRIIFLEKPACRNQSELHELLGISERCGVEVVVNHSRRFDRLHRELRQRIGSGEFGQFYRADAVYYSGWRHNGVHVVDTLCFLLNDTLKVGRVTHAETSPYEGDPTLELELNFHHIPGRVVISGMDERLYQIFDFDLRFTRARVRIEDFGGRLRIERKAVNTIGENVLEPVDTALPAAAETPMQVAIGLLVDYLHSSESSLLAGYRLADTAATYQTLWEGNRLYEQQNAKITQ